ncbi:hypothetical protein TorRG33x02_290210 [Trema orientale]|uniref:Uncharacterized protein n=1 Tax=Trema orientale TaxID=63057 RepID=A0A2P5CCH5_TREOI|nr:hypothetical protein TorRG33x02_290210 [Trema orientale]
MKDIPHFIKKHLKHSMETSSNLGLVLKRCGIYSVDQIDSLDSVEVKAEEEGGTKVLGSYNGLLALFNSDKEVALWNPSMKWYRNLHNTKIEFPGGCGNDSFDSEVKVYSLKAKAWKRVKDFPYLRHKGAHCVHPDYGDRGFHMNLGVLGDCLCVISNYTSNRTKDFRKRKSDCVDIWVMKEYGVKESWTKLYSCCNPMWLAILVL